MTRCVHAFRTRVFKCCLEAANRLLEQLGLNTKNEFISRFVCDHKSTPEKQGPAKIAKGLALKAYLLSGCAELIVNPSSSCTVILISTKMLNRWCDKLELPLPTQSHGTPNYVQSSYFPHRIRTNRHGVNILQIKSVATVRRQDVSFDCQIQPWHEDAAVTT